jgi:hypothetical protein
MTVFAIIGMRFFLGGFASCSDATVLPKADCVGVDVATGLPRAWANPWVGNFDSFPASMLTLFQASTADTLPDLIFAGMDTVGVDEPPVPTDWSWTGLYLVAWLLVGNLMALSLFVGAIVDNFGKIRSAEEGLALLTPDQKQWVHMVQALRHVEPTKPALPPMVLARLRRPIYRLIHTSSLYRHRPRTQCLSHALSKGLRSPPCGGSQNWMMLAVVININLLAFDYHRMEEDTAFYNAWLFASSCFFYFYWGEFFLKLFALGPRDYFNNGGRQFEFTLLLASILERSLTDYINPMVLRVLRVSRALRILRMLQGNTLGDLKHLLNTLVDSVPAIVNVSSILGLVMFIYAVLGMQMFTFVMQNNGLNNHANFESFGGALLLLFQVLTGDSWSGVMYGAMVDESGGCDPAPSDGAPSDCGTWLAIPYFVSYLLIGSFIFLNLVVAIVLQNFAFTAVQRDEKLRREREALPELPTGAHLQSFTALWCHFDMNGDGFIEASRLPFLIAQLSSPLGTNTAPQADDLEGALPDELGEAYQRARETGTDTPLTWTPTVDASALEAAHAMVRELVGADGTLTGVSSRSSTSTAEQLSFDDVLAALTMHAFGSTCMVERVDTDGEPLPFDADLVDDGAPAIAPAVAPAVLPPPQSSAPATAQDSLSA